ncbi:MAG: hypothetical protein ACYDDC_08335, partial [Thermoplasmataceae archaeon]
EIFSFTTKGIDATVVIKNLNVTGSYIGTFSMAMGYNSTACTNGFNPSYMNLSSGLGAIPSSDWNVTVGNLSLNWQSEDSILKTGIISSSSSGDQIILPFNPGTINHNESYTIDPMIYYQPRMIIRWPIGGTPPSPNPSFPVYLQESGLSSGTMWHATLNGQTLSSTSSEIVFSEHDGTYSYMIGSVSEYSGPSPSSGSVTVNGESTHIGTSFNHLFSITFNEIGLSHGTTWSASLDGDHTESSSSSEIVFCEPNAIYSYNIGTVSGYATPSPSSGYVSTAGGSTQVGISFGHFPTLGYLHITDTNIYRAGPYNFTSKVISSDSPPYSYFIMGAEVNNLHFSIHYSNAISQGLSDGITVSTLSTVITTGSTIQSDTGINGNGFLNFTWTPQPGAYGGFLVTFTNPYGSVNTSFDYTFDVYSRLISSTASNRPCIADSFGSSAVYTSAHGKKIGYLITTVSCGNQNPNWSSGQEQQFHFGLSFYSTSNNLSTNTYKYGICSYQQYVYYETSQNGQCSGNGSFEPYAQYQQSSSSSSGSTTVAEKAIYDTVAAALLLSDSGVGQAGGLIMTAMGPIIFDKATPSSSVSGFWSKPHSENVFCYENWNPGQTNTENLPPQIKTCVYYGCNMGELSGDPAMKVPVYRIVNNGNGNPSFIESLSMKLSPTRVPYSQATGDYALNYYGYSVSAFIVPISHIYIINGITLHYEKNDYVNATLSSKGYYSYTGPEYVASTMMPLYLPFAG